MQTAIFKDCGGLSADKIAGTFDITVLEILPARFRIERVLRAKKATILENKTIGIRHNRHRLGAGAQ